MRWIASAVLAASLALNAFLLAHRVAQVTVQVPSLHESAQPEADPRRAMPPPIFIRDASASRAELEQRLAEAERRIEELRTPDDKWTHGDPTPAVEAKVRPYLDKVFAKVGSYKLDCRGGACRIDTAVSMAVWMRDLQVDYPDAVLFEPSFSHGHAYIEPRDAALGAGMWLWWAITMKANDAVSACIKATTARGELDVELDLDEGSRRVGVRVEGSLAAAPVGLCVSRAFEDAIATITVPPDAHAVLGQPLHFVLPP